MYLYVILCDSVGISVTKYALMCHCVIVSLVYVRISMHLCIPVCHSVTMHVILSLCHTMYVIVSPCVSLCTKLEC